MSLSKLKLELGGQTIRQAHGTEIPKLRWCFLQPTKSRSWTMVKWKVNSATETSSHFFGCSAYCIAEKEHPDRSVKSQLLKEKFPRETKTAQCSWISIIFSLNPYYCCNDTIRDKSSYSELRFASSRFVASVSSRTVWQKRESRDEARREIWRQLNSCRSLETAVRRA